MNSFFPIECCETLRKIGLLIKSRRLQSRQRQKDLAKALSVSEQTLRKIEAGEPVVELRSFMLVVWQLGLVQEVFQDLAEIESRSQFIAHNPTLPKRVRLIKPKGGEF